MAAAAEVQTAETESRLAPVPLEERVLTEVNHLTEHRLPDGSYPDGVLDDVLCNLKTAVQEASMPHAVTTTEHDYEKVSKEHGVFRWMGRTAVQNAMSGYLFHRSEAARARVAVEVDEAHHAQEDLIPGVAKVFISPRMSEMDASREVAEEEHLSEDDAVRVSWVEADEHGNVKSRVLQSLLVRDVPLSAWTDMLADPRNIFEKSIQVEDKASALSVMKAHRELVLPLKKLTGGPVDIVRAVAPYIDDPVARAKVERQIELYGSDQGELDILAERIAERWLKFETELAESLSDGQATFEIRRFIAGLQHSWTEKDVEVIQNHSFGEGYLMTKQLAILLEKARQNTLWTSAAVMSGNEEVINQIDPEALKQIRFNELRIQEAWISGGDARAAEAEMNRMIAAQNVKLGGGCTGNSSNIFRSPTDQLAAMLRMPGMEADEANDWRKDSGAWKKGVCRVKKCPSRPRTTKVGPCDVCSGCQHHYDRGKDPSKVYESTKADTHEYSLAA